MKSSPKSRAVATRVARTAALLLFAAAAGATGCGHEAVPPEASAPPVMVVGAEARDLTERIEATGQLVAKAEAAVAAQVGGEVTGLLLDEGGAAKTGQVVIEIDPERRQLEVDDAAARLVQAQAELDEASREASRVEKLHARGAASGSQLDEAHTKLQMARSGKVGAQAQLGLARRALADSSVVAPFDGLIARRYVNVGEFVSPGQKLFDLVALDPIEVEFHLTEVDSGRVSVGAPVEVRVAPYPDEVFHAQVTVVSPTIDEDTRTLRVKAVISNSDGRLRPGLFARADLGVAERHGVVMVPEEAVLQRADGSVLFRLAADEHAQRVNVETGVHRDGWVEIRSGLAPADRVVVRGQTELFDGSAVSVRDADGRSSKAVSAAAADEGREG